MPGERLLERIEAEPDFHRDRDAPRQDPAALQIHHWPGFRACRTGAKHPGRAIEKLPLPTRDPVRMHVEQLRQLGQPLLTLASVFSPLIAASATFASNAGVWFRRTPLVIALS